MDDELDPEQITEYAKASIGAFEVTEIVTNILCYGYELHANNINLSDLSDVDTLMVRKFIDERACELIGYIGDAFREQFEESFGVASAFLDQYSKAQMSPSLVISVDEKKAKEFARFQDKRWWEVWK